jgi:hypothetical protein
VRERERERKERVGSSRQAVQKNKNQEQYVVWFLLWQKFWQTRKNSGLDGPGTFNLVGSLKLIQSVHRVKWS